MRRSQLVLGYGFPIFALPGMSNPMREEEHFNSNAARAEARIVISDKRVIVRLLDLRARVEARLKLGAVENT